MPAGSLCDAGTDAPRSGTSAWCDSSHDFRALQPDFGSVGGRRQRTRRRRARTAVRPSHVKRKVDWFLFVLSVFALMLSRFLPVAFPSRGLRKAAVCELFRLAELVHLLFIYQK